MVFGLYQIVHGVDLYIARNSVNAVMFGGQVDSIWIDNNHINKIA